MQTTSFPTVIAVAVMGASKEVLDLELFLADARSLVPVNFSHVDCLVRQLHFGDALSFPPATATVESPEASKLSYTRAGGECLRARDLADDREVHGRILPYASAPTREEADSAA